MLTYIIDCPCVVTADGGCNVIKRPAGTWDANIATIQRHWVDVYPENTCIEFFSSFRDNIMKNGLSPRMQVDIWIVLINGVWEVIDLEKKNSQLSNWFLVVSQLIVKHKIKQQAV